MRNTELQEVTFRTIIEASVGSAHQHVKTLNADTYFITTVTNDWFENPDWRTRKDNLPITKSEAEGIISKYGRDMKGRIKYFNKQARAWNRIYQ